MFNKSNNHTKRVVSFAQKLQGHPLGVSFRRTVGVLILETRSARKAFSVALLTRRVTIFLINDKPAVDFV